MSVVVEKGVITAPASTGVQTYNLGSAFNGILPKAILLWATYETADALVNGDEIFAMGMGTRNGGSTQQVCVSHWGQDGAAAGNYVRGHTWNNRILTNVTSDVTTAEFIATLDSFTSGTPSNFKLNWTDIPASQIKVHYWIIGGSDITDAYVGTPFIDDFAATPQDFTISVGFGQPDLMIVQALYWTSQNIFSQGGGRLAMSAFREKGGTIEQRALAYGADETADMSVAIWQKSSAMLSFTSSAGAADMDSVLSARANWPTDGFEITYNDTSSFPFPFGLLALKGTFRAKIGAATIPTTPGDQSLTLPGGVPKGALFWGGQMPQSASVQISGADLGGFALGGTDGTNEGMAMVCQDDGNATSSASRAFTTTKAFARHIADPGGGAATLDAEADSSISGSNVVLNWADAAGAAAEFNYLIIGEALTGSPREVTVVL
jgi:hypothetical protein